MLVSICVLATCLDLLSIPDRPSVFFFSTGKCHMVFLALSLFHFPQAKVTSREMKKTVREPMWDGRNLFKSLAFIFLSLEVEEESKRSRLRPSHFHESFFLSYLSLCRSFPAKEALALGKEPWQRERKGKRTDSSRK